MTNVSGWIAIAGALGQLALAARQPSLAQHEVLEKYCATCHSERVKTAGLVLSNADLARIPDNADTWEKVVRKLRAGAMPPHGAPRPDGATLDGLASWLETSLDEAARNPNPGPAILRRLNRAEYAAAVRDILALDVDVSSLLPADDANHGFDNMADSLRISPALLDGYLSASRESEPSGGGRSHDYAGVHHLSRPPRLGPGRAHRRPSARDPRRHAGGAQLSLWMAIMCSNPDSR